MMKKAVCYVPELSTMSHNGQTEMNNTLEGINNRITEAEAQIYDLDDRMVEITAIKQNIEKRMKRNEDSLRYLYDNIKCITVSL